MKKHILLFAIFVTLLASCSKEEQTSNQAISSGEGACKSITRNILINPPCPYVDMLDTSIYAWAAFLHYNDNPLYADQYAVVDSDPIMNISANGLQLISSQSYSSTDFEELFGSSVSFVVDQSDIGIYIPKRIAILSPEISDPEDLLPFCYYGDFELSWNEDAANTNGILVVVEWTGTMYGEDDIHGAHIQNIDYIPNDNGVAVLNNALFDMIPEDAICDLTIIRGNSDVAEYNGTEEVRVGGFSASSITFILVRDMSRYDPI
ncbi:MAG: hypothetical protein ACOCXH_12930 [Cyclobacteriaceae bacterium]